MIMSLISLPDEVHGLISKELDIGSLANLRATCRAFEYIYTRYAFNKISITFEREHKFPHTPRVVQKSVLIVRDTVLHNISHIKVLGGLKNIKAFERPVFQVTAEMQMEVLLRRMPRNTLRSFEWNLNFSGCPATIFNCLKIQTNLVSLRLKLGCGQRILDETSTLEHWDRFRTLQRLHLEDLTQKADIVLADILIMSADHLTEIRICFAEVGEIENILSNAITEIFVERTLGRIATTEQLLDHLYNGLATRHSPAFVYLSNAKLMRSLLPLFCPKNLRALTLRGCSDLATAIPTGCQFRLEHLHLHLKKSNDWELMWPFFKNLQPGLIHVSILTKGDRPILPNIFPDAFARHSKTLKSLAFCHRERDGWMRGYPPDILLNTAPGHHSLDECLMILDWNNPERLPWKVTPEFYIFVSRLRAVHLLPHREYDRTKLDGGYRLAAPIQKFLENIAKNVHPNRPRIQCIVVGLRGEKNSVFKVTWMQNPLHPAKPRYISSVQLTDAKTVLETTDLSLRLYSVSFATEGNFEVLPVFE